jgi:hypothetical protein
MSSLKERVIQDLEERRENVLTGKINCIPSPFTRFRSDFVGIMKGCYYLISGGAKSGKTKITNQLFVYSPLLYAYEHPDQVKLKIFYYALEETKEEILTRFMSYLLYTMSGGVIRISPLDLRSTNSDKVVSQDVLDLLKSEEYNKLLDFFEEHVIFGSSANPTGIWVDMTKYAEANGNIHYKDVEITDKNTGELKVIKAFDYYEPVDPDEYVMIIVDHVSLLGLERGMNTRETINKLSEYMVILRNKYNYIPVIVQQQSSETLGLDAYRANKIKPTLTGLGDSKYTARDSSLFLGITNPYAHEMPNYYNYDITKLKDNFRLLEVVMSRIGPSNGAVGLYFDGATGFIKELPPPNNKEALDKIYKYIEKIRQR